MAARILTLEDARALDAADALAPFRRRFALPDDIIYLDGNSLGALPFGTSATLSDVIGHQWGHSLIRSWNDHDWIGAPARIGDKIAQLIGAGPGEVIVADSTSINAFKLLVALIQMNPERTKIVTEEGNFPTDLHIAEGVADMFGKRLVTARAHEIRDAICADTAAVLLCHVHYRTSCRHDITSITAHAHAVGTRIIWDLSHSVGAIPLNLHAEGAELAIGCGYKFLNGGPGAPAFLYVARDLQSQMMSPIRGWMGHADPFAFGDRYAPAPGIDRFLAGTPPILGLAALETGVDLMLQAEAPLLFDKSRRLFALFASLMEARCPEFTMISPGNANERGSHIAFSHPRSAAISNALIARGVIGDFRAPDVLRFGLTPLYLRFEDIWKAVDTLAEIMATRAWSMPEYGMNRRVT